MPKLLLFPKPSPATIHIVRQNITFRIGKETYAMTIHTKIERATAQPVDTPSPDFQRDRELEFRKLECAPPDSDPDADPTRGPSLCAPGGEAGR